MYNIKNRSVHIRKRSFLYDHVQKEHRGEIPPLKLEIVRRCPSDPGLRQATEAVSIREFRPPLNGKDEWTNEPRKRREKVPERNIASDVTRNDVSSNVM